MSAPIRFGTDGWRGVIARDFTFQSVARVAEGVARYLESQGRLELDVYKRWLTTPADPHQGVVIGYDMRFQARAFAEELARVLQEHRIPVWIAPEAVPTPALSYAVVHQSAALGLMVTASHNPPEYLGVKIKTELGSAAPPEITKLVERMTPEEPPLGSHGEREAFPTLDLKGPFLARIKELIDVKTLQNAPLKVVVDAMYGSARGYIAQVLEELEIPHITVRHGRDPYFGGHGPEPTRKYLTPLKAVLRAEAERRLRRRDGKRLLVGVVTDGDGDRVAAMDENGDFIDPHRCFALLLDYLWDVRGLRGKVVKSFTLSDMAFQLAEKHHAPIDEVPVGFKYVSEKLLTDDVLIGGEESGGIAIKGHIPERDGVLMALLLLEMVAYHRKPIGQIIDGLMQEIGYHYYDRRDLHLAERLEVVEKLRAAEPKAFAGKTVRKIETLDGVKLRFDDGWLLFRASGTEPLLRIYCELDDPTEVQRVLDQAERFARGELALL
jgi:phosphomannomutase